MNLTADFSKDISVVKLEPGAYEWWYFDGRDHKGEYQFVLIFYEGCPFSSKYIKNQDKNPNHDFAKASNYPAISISIYKNGKPVYYSMSEYGPNDATFNRDRVSLRVGDNTLEGFIDDNDMLVYAIRLDETLPSGDHISGIMRFISPKPNPELWSKLKSSSSTSAHSWNLVQPVAQVKGVLSVRTGDNHEKPIVFDGVGYHDHNIGREPMKNEFKDWYWGRIHFNDYSLVYYVMNTKNGQEAMAWIISADNQSVIEQASNVRVDGVNVNGFGLSSARRIEIQFYDLQILVQCRQIIDNGPFYMRFKTEARIQRAGETDELSFGISEYIRPSRIHSRIFWPLVHMRYRFAAHKPHWVQRSRFFYRWTW